MSAMRIAELSERSGTTVPTIKYYLREGVLPRGERTGPNQARYGEEHLRRLRLVRALTDVGGLPVATVREILAHVDAPAPDTHRLLGHALHDLVPRTGGSGPANEDDHARVDALSGRHGWTLHPGEPAHTALKEVVAAYRLAGHPVGDDVLDGYVEAVERIAEIDLDTLADHTETDSLLETAVVNTVLGDTLLALLRRFAQKKESARRTGTAPEDP